MCFFTGGLALQFLALCYWLIDIRDIDAGPGRLKFWSERDRFCTWLRIDCELLGLIKVAAERHSDRWIYDHVFASWASPINASLAFAISFVLVCLD